VTRYGYLEDEQREFLDCFLLEEGNFSAVQKKIGISNQEAKKRLRNILSVLWLEKSEDEHDVIDLSGECGRDSKKASDIIRNNLIDGDGKATVESQTRRSQYNILLAKGKNSDIADSFICDKLKPIKKYELRIFDIVVELLLEQGGKARKGNGRDRKIGEADCTYDTVAGRIGKDYFGKNDGDSMLDPVFVLNAMLLWAGICKTTDPGYMELSESYRAML
jgi:hypothetical protein